MYDILSESLSNLLSSVNLKECNRSTTREKYKLRHYLSNSS